jgi:membrane fusion protein (multidrug efflux system)
MRKQNIFRTTIAAASIAAGMLMLTGCNDGQASTTAATEQTASTPLPVEVVTPQVNEVYATYHTTTNLTSDSDAPVLARVAGEVVEILVEEGDLVGEGQILARLDGDRLRLEMNASRAKFEKTSREYERYLNLHDRGLVSAAALDEMKYSLDALRASYELRKLDYEYTRIRAPIAGVISNRNIKLGEHINPNDMAFRVTDTSRLVAYMKIPQSELANISAGDVATISVDAVTDQKFAATIARVSPTIDMKNGTFRATAYVDNARGKLAPGMFGRFDIAYERHENAITIPTEVVVQEDNQFVVYVVTDGEAVRQVVTIGIEDEGVVEILSGITESDQVVVTGQNSLRDGSRVLASIPDRIPAIG